MIALLLVIHDRRKTIQRLTVVLLLAVLVASCSRDEPASPRPVVAVSVLPQVQIVEQVAGNLVEVVAMLPKGANPTTFEPTINQIVSLSRAVLYVKVGHPNFPFEKAWLGSLISHSPSIEVIDMAADLTVTEGDPHIWCSPRLVRQMTTRIAAALSRLFPARRAEIAARRAAFQSEIDALDREIRTQLADLPDRRFLVFHPAWGYFANEYELEQVAIEHGHRETSAHELAMLIAEAKKSGIKTVFVQPQMSKRSAEIVAGEIGGTLVVADPLAKDWLANLRHVARQLSQAMSR